MVGVWARGGVGWGMVFFVSSKYMSLDLIVMVLWFLYEIRSVIR